MIKRPITTEKAIRMIELDNIIAFEVDPHDNKTSISKNVENNFKVKVEKVNIMNKGSRKIAYVKINKKHQAIDIASKLGMI